MPAALATPHQLWSRAATIYEKVFEDEAALAAVERSATATACDLLARCGRIYFNAHDLIPRIAVRASERR